jgi:hypothetical protein
MRQVDEAELVWSIRYRLGRLSATLRKGLNDPRAEQRHRYEQMVAEVIVKEGLRRYEVLTDTPLPPGSDLFSRAAYGGGDGQSPMIEDVAR